MSALWKYVASSVVGRKHLNQKTASEDFSKAFWNEPSETLILVAADGAGYADYAALGAKKAIEFVEVYVAEQLELNPALITYQYDLRQFLLEIAENTRLRLFELAEQMAVDQSTELEQLATTLLLCICSPSWFGALQIGDGFILTLNETGEMNPVFMPSKGHYANETVFLTSFDSFHALSEQGHVKTNVQDASSVGAIVMFTDGLEYAAMSMRGTPKPQYSFMFKLLKQLSFLEEAAFKQRLETYLLNSEKLHEITDDDKTLILAIQKQDPAFLDKLEAKLADTPAIQKPEDLKGQKPHKPGSLKLPIADHE